MNRTDCRIFYNCTDKSNYIDSHINLLSKSTYFANHFNNNKSKPVEKDNYVMNGYEMKFDFKQSTLLNIFILLNGKVIYNDKEYLNAIVFLQLEEYLPKIIEHLLDLILNLNKIHIINEVLKSKISQEIKNNFNARIYYLTPNKLDENMFYNQTYTSKTNKNKLVVYGHWNKLIHNHKFDGVQKELYFDTNEIDLTKDELFFSIGCENGEEPDPMVPPSYSCNAKIQLIIYDGFRKDTFDIAYRSQYGSGNELPIRLPGYSSMASYKIGGLPRDKYIHKLKNIYNKHMVHEFVITFI